MNNIKISQLDENLSPSLNAVTVIVEDDVAKQSTIQSIKETIFSDDVDLTGNLMVTGDTQSIYNWTSPNDTTWSIVEYKGHTTLTITGSTGSMWFPFSGVPMSNGSSNMDNFVRGGIIDYFAVCDGTCGTLQSGTVTFVRDQGPTTNETRASFGCNLYFGEGSSDDGLKVWSDGGTGEMNLIVQWSAKLFYAEEWFC